MGSLRERFLKHLAQTTSFPLMLEVVRAEGIYLYDPQGKAYIDLIAGISVSSLGHCHPEIVQSVQEQAASFMHTMVYGEYVLGPQVELASLLSSVLPEKLNCAYFLNSGSEAVEGALKLAKRYTGRPRIVSCKNAYHGSSHGAVSLMSDTFFTQAYRPLLPGIDHIEFNNEETLGLITSQTACVVVETVQAESGVHPPKKDFLKKLRKRCDETGALLIFDEIQVGYGRTGSLFAFEQYGVEPDILLLAKAMGGGMPIGAFICSTEMMNVLSHQPLLGHITTFGGHPVSTAAALTTLKILIRDKHLINTVKAKAALFKKLLVHPEIKEIRNAGLIMAVEFRNFDFLEKLIKNCLDNGLIIDWFLFNNKCMRIAPPLIITETQIRQSCEIILNALNAIS